MVRHHDKNEKEEIIGKIYEGRVCLAESIVRNRNGLHIQLISNMDLQPRRALLWKTEYDCMLYAEEDCEFCENGCCMFCEGDCGLDEIDYDFSEDQAIIPVSLGDIVTTGSQFNDGHIVLHACRITAIDNNTAKVSLVPLEKNCICPSDDVFAAAIYKLDNPLCPLPFYIAQVSRIRFYQRLNGALKKHGIDLNDDLDDDLGDDLGDGLSKYWEIE